MPYPPPDPYKIAWYQFTAEEWSGFTNQHWYWFVPYRLVSGGWTWFCELFVDWVPSIRGKVAVDRDE